MDVKIHPETGAELRRGVRVLTVRVGSQSETASIPGWYPEGAGDGLHSGEDLAGLEAAQRRLRVGYAAHLRSSRKRWRMTQEQASALVGGGKRAFQKYESGKAIPTEAAVGLIELLNADARNLKRLKEMRGLGA